jgi:hypothetical protein
MQEILFDGKQNVETYKGWVKDVEGDDILRPTEKFYEMTREE